MTVIDIKQLKERAVDYAEDCSDAKSKLRTFAFGEDNSLAFETENKGVAMQGVFNDWSFNQLCYKLNVPAGWVGNPKNCPEPLKIKILSELAGIYRDDGDYLLRMKGNVLRAILSSQYSIFDNLEFVDLIEEAVATMGIEAKVHRYTVGDDMRAYLVFPSVTFAPDPQAQSHENGDNGGLHPAMYISNSERGGGSARVAGAVYRAICTNGVIFGWKSEEGLNVRHRYHSKAMMGAMVADGIAEALRMSEEATRRFIASQDVKIKPVSLAGIVDQWAGKYGITVSTKENWLASITTESVANGRKGDPRLFDIVNAATYVAQTASEFETERMERIAGAMLQGHAALH